MLEAEQQSDADVEIDEDGDNDGSATTPDAEDVDEKPREAAEIEETVQTANIDMAVLDAPYSLNWLMAQARGEDVAADEIILT